MTSQRTRASGREASSERRRFLLSASTVGFGLGAVVDVVLFHLVFQTHHLLSGAYDPYSFEGLRTNVMFDGLFLGVMLGVMGLGIAGCWRLVNGSATRFSARYAIGALVVGMGTFNVVDGVVSHYVLDLHNVVHGTVAWNPHWLAVSLALLAAGGLLLRSADGYRVRP
ncbi:DUF2243 domain-containing protein [Halobiforma nitratireducens]|uniref:DUF2243 domain-containing protein n=1 Tax=Halobiforma nitratireducens JCM 10879 TaxID=1227454 RepID=M0M2W2_9EURY|nr:DUF2243 domain-containing protein [Halobiforma nitratireducens]EMA38745.1 hypothetical protein C446_09493 [Halobiforma nitratireducens JCM 10879]